MTRFITAFDRIIIGCCRTLALPVSRISIAIVYIWFGILKLGSTSAAAPLVQALHDHMIPFFSIGDTMIVLSIFEITVGIVILIPHFERLALFLFGVHMIIVSFPLYILPTYTWQAPFVPTLEGQYIMKNLVLIALAISIVAHLHPFTAGNTRKV